ncbi:uncharacterized protein LOC129611895 [Condylostylus longicornis]|uniref:uncharacterized protein LOC129611895 n=1 Tax=Condylostylus longicornis TaxID=2530218 RepID=UPI00244E439B|nr:uncharacterized protein LOC129611895 [Condylostylus longicornis]
MDEKVKISTNWCLLRGKNIGDSLVIKTVENYCKAENRPSIDDIVSFEQSVHLQEPQDNKDDNQLNLTKINCNIQFEIHSAYYINYLTLVTDCQKVEMFVDIHNEYYNTFIGEFLDDFDGMKVYRFDIKITKKISHFLLKLIPRVPEIWVYGIQVVISNGQLVDMTPSLNNINIDNVKSILSSSKHKLTPKAMECKTFIESFLHGAPAKNFNNLDGTTGFLKCSSDLENFKSLLSNTKKNFLQESNRDDSHCSYKIDELKKYIDKVIYEMENNFRLELQALEKRQNEKLDRIIEILSSTQNKIVK